MVSLAFIFGLARAAFICSGLMCGSLAWTGATIGGKLRESWWCMVPRESLWTGLDVAFMKHTTDSLDHEPMLKEIRPFWNRVTVMESPVDEMQAASGIILPFGDDGSRAWRRGIVVNAALDNFTDTDGQLTPGTVVYWTGGFQIMDVWVVDTENVLAYEA